MAIRKVAEHHRPAPRKGPGRPATGGQLCVIEQDDLSGTSQWSDYSGTSESVQGHQTAKDAIRSPDRKARQHRHHGRRRLKSMRQHPAIIDRIRYTGRDSITLGCWPQLWGLIASWSATPSHRRGWNDDRRLGQVRRGRLHHQGSVQQDWRRTGLRLHLPPRRGAHVEQATPIGAPSRTSTR